MSKAVHNLIDIGSEHNLSCHAWKRMGGRGFSAAQVRRVLNYGRRVHVRGAAIYAVGRKEVERFETVGVDLAEVEGMQIVCTPDGVVLTMYRNHDFRGLRPSNRRGRRRWQG